MTDDAPTRPATGCGAGDDMQRIDLPDKIAGRFRPKSRWIDDTATKF